MNSRNIVFTEPNVTELLTEEVKPLGKNDVMVKIAVSTISSGTEKANLVGEVNTSVYSNRTVAHFPRRVGYSSAGVVVEVGEGVTSLQKGDRVALSWSKHAEYCVVPEANTYKLDDETSFEEGAMWHISTFPMSAIRKCRLEIGESAIVMGVGILGMMAIKLLKAAGAKTVFGLDEILTAPINGSGYNENYGLLGSNKATEEQVKLFPRDCQSLVLEIQKRIYDATGKKVEVMVYGDGAFKDPIGKIWELADPVVSPAYTDGLEGTPNELKLKYLADNDFANLSGDALKEAIKGEIQKKDDNLVGKMASEGTTPRRLTDLIGSLCDLTSGSGDKGTPIVFIQGYFDNYTTE